MEPLNRTATELVDEAIDFADELRIGVRHLDNEAVVLDFGVEAPGGLEAGLLLAELRTGGLATVATRLGALEGAPHTHVELSTDHPELALLASARAGWRLPGGAWASGPGQLLRDDEQTPAGAPEESFDFAVLAVESTELPDEELAAEIAEACGVSTAGTFLAVAPAASVAGATALAASAAEVALHRLEHVGGDPSGVRAATGRAPLPPVADDELAAKGRANDAVAYGGRAQLVAEGPIDGLDELPFGATAHAGDSFEDLVAEADGDLAALEGAFAPAAVTVDAGGELASHGETDEARLAAAWGR